MQKIAVIVAGGTGKRMNSELPKQFLLLNGKALLWHSINAFAKAYNDIEIIVVTHEDYIDKTRAITNGFNPSIQIIKGGETRFDSVKNGLSIIKKAAIIFVHDAVRSLINIKLIQNCYEQALAKGSAIPAVAATDSIRIINADEHCIADRNNIRIIQTPQTFKSDILLPAFNVNYNESFTDEATVVEASGKKIYLIEGDYNNIKITRPVDIIIAESLMNKGL